MRLKLFSLVILVFFCGFKLSLPFSNFQDARDGETYRSVTIDDVQLMTTNLKYETDFSYCYSNLDRYCGHYGKLYNVEELDLSQGKLNSLCPEGWHIPSLEEWDLLIRKLGPKVKLNKQEERVYVLSQNNVGFQFGGFKSHQEEHYFNLGKQGHYLTSTFDGTFVSTLKVKRAGDVLELSFNNETEKGRSVSCRCIR